MNDKEFVANIELKEEIKIAAKVLKALEEKYKPEEFSEAKKVYSEYNWDFIFNE